MFVTVSHIHLCRTFVSLAWSLPLEGCSVIQGDYSSSYQTRSEVTNTLAYRDAKETEQHALKSVNTCLNTNICSYLETSGGQSSNLNLNVVHFFQRQC